MAKKRKKAKSYMMVIRVRVPAKLVPKMKVSKVFGAVAGDQWSHDLEILNAFYDKTGMPNAMPAGE